MNALLLRVSVCLLLAALQPSVQDCIIDHRTPEVAWEQKLQEDLKARGHKYTPMCNGTQPLEVRLRFTMKSFTFNEVDNEFRIFSWIYMTWKHDQLTWDPKDYGGISESTLESGLQMWYPTYRVINSPTAEEIDHYYLLPCQIFNTGKVFCAPKFEDSVICVGNYRDWPHDRQTCLYDIGHWNNSRPPIKLRFNKRAISMIGAEYGGEWDIMDYKQEEGVSKDVQLRMTFVIERHSEGLAVLVVAPGGVLAALTLTALALDARGPVRAPLACFSLMGHLYYLSELQEWLPHESHREPPRLLLYYRGSLLVTALLAALTLLLRVLCRQKTPPPSWLEAVARYNLLPPYWDTDQLPEHSKTWVCAANLLNTVSVLTFVVVYVCLYAIFVPQPYPIES